MIDATLQAQVAARRDRIQRKREEKFVLPIPGYADLLAARYRVLEFEDKEAVLDKHETDESGVPLDKVGSSADMLIRACVELLHVTGENAYESLGTGWTTATINSVFGVERDTVRQALREALGSDAVMEHFNAYIDRVNAIRTESEEVAQGEPVPADAGSPSSPIAQP